jgi:hypothetical protein
MELIGDKGSAYKDMSKFDIEFLKNVVLERYLEVNGKQSTMFKQNTLKKKYGELIKANPNLLDDLFNKFPEFNEDYVPPEPESVLKFYEDFYAKYGNVKDDEDESKSDET